MRYIGKSELMKAALMGVIGGVVAYFAYDRLSKKNDTPSQWQLYEEMSRGYDTVEKREPVEREDVVVKEVDLSYKVVADEKPDISKVLEVIARKTEESSTVEEKKKEEANEMEVSYGVQKIQFDDDGIPIFSESDWDSEEGNISFMSQSEYINSFMTHNKEQAVWFTKSSVMVDSSLTPMDVVDTVGPTAFTTLMKAPDMTVFVKNNELETDYELLTNDSVTIEEAWEDQGVI